MSEMKLALLHICIAAFLFLLPCESRSQDVVILKNGQKYQCEITKIDSINIYMTIQRDGQPVSTFSAKDQVSSYRFGNPSDSAFAYTQAVAFSNIFTSAGQFKKHYPVAVMPVKKDTITKRFINLLSYVHKFGVNSNDWAIEYFGQIQTTSDRFFYPVSFGIEKLTLREKILRQSNCGEVNLYYFSSGVNPMKRLNKWVYIKLGCQLLIGEEEELYYSYYATTTEKRFLLGVELGQSILLIPKQGFGVNFGIGLFEMFSSSKVYNYDVGLQIQAGLSF